jgi:hypothetical protein
MIVTIPTLTGDGPETYPPGRVCTSCPTILSIYTRGTRCAVCSPPRQRLNTSAHGRAMRDLIEMMEEVA